MESELSRIFDETSGPDALRRVVDALRPPETASTDVIDARLEALVETLEADDRLLEAFDLALVQTLSDSKLDHAFTDSGILEQRGFFAEFTSRLVRRVLPRQQSEDATRHQILRIFEPGDWRWVTGSSLEVWIRLFEVVTDHHCWRAPDDQIRDAMRVLARRIAAAGLDDQFQSRLDAIGDQSATTEPFVELTSRTDTFAGSTLAEGLDYDELDETIEQCRRAVSALREHRDAVGTNLRLTRKTRRLRQQLDRLEQLAQLCHPTRGLAPVTCTAMLFRRIVEAEKTATSLGSLVSKSTDLVAYQIAEQGARKGHKYITDTARGYVHFLRAALQGGAIVAPFAILKLLMARQGWPVGVEALAFSINYAVCFTLLSVTGSILATKQPAVTASAIARKIDEATNSDEAVQGVADVVVLVWRSQFVSFVGNLAAALPLGALITWVALRATGAPLADPGQAEYLLDGVHPWASATLFYAAVAGIGLFLSGILAGAVDNHLTFAEVPRRIRDHPGLGWLGDRRDDLADFVDKHTGTITGNVALGFFLGTAGPLGVALGLPLDIRHIAFSSAELGVATYTLPEIATSTVGAIALVGVLGIGFFNFLVCFLLTLGAGLDARALTFAEVRRLVPLLLRRAVTRPWEWFVPTTKPRYHLPEDIPEM